MDEYDVVCVIFKQRESIALAAYDCVPAYAKQNCDNSPDDNWKS